MTGSHAAGPILRRRLTSTICTSAAIGAYQAALLQLLEAAADDLAHRARLVGNLLVGRLDERRPFDQVRSQPLVHLAKATSSTNCMRSATGRQK